MSNNLISGEDKQERLDKMWIVGFTDGEGCFSISIIKNDSLKFGYQIFPEFVLTQGAKSLEALRRVQSFFECGRVYENKRHDNHHENLFRYCIRSRADLVNKVCPFFRENPLMTAKKFDFELFCQVLEMMEENKHLTYDGFVAIRAIASKMNHRKSRIPNDQTPESI